MQVSIHISEDAFMMGEWFLLCNNKKVLLCEEKTSFLLSKSGEYELTLANSFQRNKIKYILLWVINMLIAPINMLLMNTESEWYNQIIPSTIKYKFKCNFQKDTEVFLSIKCRNLKQYISNTYSIKISSMNCDITELSSYEDYSNNNFIWELNKYISKLFSIESWVLLIIFFICFFSGVSHSRYIFCAFTIIFVFIMVGSLTYTFYKAKKIYSVLKEMAQKQALLTPKDF